MKTNTKLKETAMAVVENSHHSWLSVDDIVANLEEDGFVVEPMNTLQQAFLFARDDHYKKIAYNPTLSLEEQTKALLNSYGYYLLSEDLTSNFLLKYVTDISEEQQKIIRDFRHEVLQLSAQKEIHSEQFASSQPQPNKQMIKKSNS